MTNLPNGPSPVEQEQEQWREVPAATVERLNMLVRLMLDLRSLGRGSVLYLDGKAEPVLSVPVLSRRRSMAVLVVQEGGGWSYLWDSVHRTPGRSVRVAAERIAGVTR
ncbi:hypothetical protein [Actinomadura sp. 7K507]|uniref:hypothetical protein n=1 Tax=Actinomadura sp. 7K507 TaxID=2530365 RepID=UPI0010454885|nr:hypothetical protein [Actinomadura sp. 7K507]TDC86893.1 hypothetical protein E1285_21965 [Actinomadura sp. 7K507]